ncbi:GIP, partial [Symbiodinium sp. KB8]
VEPEDSYHTVGHPRTGLWLKAVVCPMVWKAEGSLETSFHTDLWGNLARQDHGGCVWSSYDEWHGSKGFHRMVAGDTGDEQGALVTEDSGETVEYAGDQTFWFARFRGMIQRGDQSSTGSIQPEVVQEEVRRAVQQAMQQRDSKMNDLQQENAELKQLLMAMIDVLLAMGRGQPLNQGKLQGLTFLDEGNLSYQQSMVMAGLTRSTTPVTTAEGGGREDAAGKPLDGAGADLGGQARGDGLQEPAVGDTSPSTPLGLLAQGIQQLQQLQLRKDGQDPELLKGSIELPKLPEPYQDASAVAFLEWVYEAGQAVGSITDRASTWWDANLDLAMTAYHKFQAKTPLKRLTIQAGEDPKVDNETWSRLEKRVMTLLLAAMSSSIKAEITMLRIHRVKDCLFKLYTIFAPGGASERASLIKQLEHIPAHTSVVETIAALGRWKKLMGRAAEMGVSLPDGSVLLMALEGATRQITEGNKDISFKLNMAKNELGLPHKPTLSSVLVYADHIAAELQQVIPFNKDQAAKLKAATIDPGSPGSASASPSGKGQGQKQPCKFWLTDEGCRRGAGCKYGHVFQTKEDKKETKTAKRVRVQLADGRAVYLRQNPGGTLLSEEEGGGTILPLGSLVESLGCRLEWTRRHGLRVHHPRYGLLPTKLIGNTPVLREAEALQLIVDMEQVELDKLEANVTEGAIRTLSVDDAPATWLDHLEEFINKGERACLRRMLLDEESPVKALSEQEVNSLLGVEERLLLSDDAGAHYLKALPVNRATRKRLLRTRWVVHLYNGDEQGPEFARAESDDVTVIRMDMKDSKAYDLRFANGAVRALMWAAARGQIEAALGAPPRGPEHSSLLFKRMMLLWLVANSGAALNALCAPSFTLELPTWHHFWTSSAWLSFRDELRFLKYHSVACQGNLYFLASSLGMSDGLDVDEAMIPTLNYTTPASSWPSTLKVALAQALLNWRRSDMRRHEAVLSKLIGNRELNAKDLEYWQRHINNNHLPYDRRCKTCVRSSGTGRAHRRCLTPSAYSLSLDIAGPMRTKGESPDGKKYRYLLVGAYTHPKLDLPKDIPFPDEEEEEIEPELDPFEEDEGATVPDEEEDDEQKEMSKRFQKIYEGIGDNIEYQTLHFAVPMNTRTSKEVRSKIQQIYLQLRQHGLPLVRIHSDRGLELKAKETRSWMADRDILATTGESQQPQQNGRAEALVRTIKRRVKTLLRSAGLPMACWPSAGEFSARRQRDLALGNYEDKDLPYGAPTHVKYKRFGEGGRYDLLERWKEGVFVGYSNDVARGKVVRHSDGSYTTSVHIRPYLIDTEDLVEFGPHEMEVPVPERRVRGKASVAQLLQEPISDLDRAAKKHIDEGKYDLETVVELWEMLRSRARRTTRNSQGEGLQWMVGQYTHGGQCGVVNDTNAYPFVTLYLVKAFKELTGINDFTSLLITEDVGMKCHRDVHNYVGRSNVLLPLLPCEDGGGVWVEADPGSYSFQDEWRQLPNRGWRRGRVHELQPGVPVVINPRRYHATEPWRGRRLVMTTYTPRTSSMKQPTYEILRDYGFEPPPLSPQVPEHLQQAVLRMLSVDPVKDPDINEAVLFLVKEVEGERRQRTQQISEELQQLQEDVLGRLKERREWLQEFLAEEEILAEEIGVVGESINEEIMGINDVVRDLIHDVEAQVTEVEKKCESLYLRVANVDDDKEIGDIEEYLANLKKDLEVTLDVPLDQVKRNLDQWVEPMAKELANLEEKTGAIERWSIAEARKLESEGRLILIPGKVVCTVKPPAPLGPGSPPSTTPRWKRKARVVICGNLAGQSHDPNDLFAAGASVEGLRLALAIAMSMGWCVAATDVSAAFLQAKWPRDRPTYGVLPPKILQQAGLVEHGVVFIVRRALYGLRESPALWAAHRTQVLEELFGGNKGRKSLPEADDYGQRVMDDPVGADQGCQTDPARHPCDLCGRSPLPCGQGRDPQPPREDWFHLAMFGSGVRNGRLEVPGHGIDSG